MRRMTAVCVVACLAVIGCSEDEEPAGPSHTYEQDRAAIRAILDVNGLASINVNDVTSWDSVSGLARRLNLRPSSIDLSGPIDTIPPEIAVLTALTHLFIDSNMVRSLPTEIGSCGSLKYLYASENQLSALPVQLFSVRTLESVNVSGNRLTAIPEQVAQLTALRVMDVSRNQLTVLPEGLAALTNVEVFEFANNQICALSAGVEAWLSAYQLYDPATWRNYQACITP
jgi:Leucine-rich repeat (LRR) protein